jgi:hypothetical protein
MRRWKRDADPITMSLKHRMLKSGALSRSTGGEPAVALWREDAERCTTPE